MSTSGEKRARSRNFTEVEKETFIDICQGYIHVIENKVINALTNKEKCEAWEKIADKYNMTQTTGYRNPIQMKSLYEQLKKNARKNKGNCTGEKVKHSGIIEEKVRALLPDVQSTVNIVSRENSIVDLPTLSFDTSNHDSDLSDDQAIDSGVAFEMYRDSKRKKYDELLDRKIAILDAVLEAEKEKCEAFEKIAEKYNMTQTTGYRNIIQMKSLYQQLKTNARKNKGNCAEEKVKHSGIIAEKVRALLPDVQSAVNIASRESSTVNLPTLPFDASNHDSDLSDDQAVDSGVAFEINKNSKRKKYDELLDRKIAILDVILEAEKENLKVKKLENEIKEIEYKIKCRELEKLNNIKN